MKKNYDEVSVLAHVFTAASKYINNLDYDDDYKIDKQGYVTTLELMMSYNTTYEHRQELLQLERYIINHSCKYDKQPIEHYLGYLIESTVYHISDYLEITISWFYEL